jgi:hypothetical protein
MGKIAADAVAVTLVAKALRVLPFRTAAALAVTAAGACLLAGGPGA